MQKGANPGLVVSKVNAIWGPTLRKKYKTTNKKLAKNSYIIPA